MELSRRQSRPDRCTGSRPSDELGRRSAGQSQTVPLLDNLNGGADIGEALFPYASALDNQDVPGIRGTLGVALTGGEMELSFFGMEQSTSSMAAEDLSAARTRVGLADVAFGTTDFPNLAVPLLTDGLPGTVADLNALIFSESFSAKMDSQMWGSEFALLTEKSAPGGAGASWQWLGGFRYVNLDEGFGFSAGFYFYRAFYILIILGLIIVNDDFFLIVEAPDRYPVFIIKRGKPKR